MSSTRPPGAVPRDHTARCALDPCSREMQAAWGTMHVMMRTHVLAPHVTLVLLVAGCVAQREGAVMTPSDRPIACALTPDELNARREQLLPGLLRRANEVTDLEDGLRMRFESRAGLLAELVGIIEQERTCCSFLRFQLTAEPDDGSVVFDVTGPPGTREMLRKL